MASVQLSKFTLLIGVHCKLYNVHPSTHVHIINYIGTVIIHVIIRSRTHKRLVLVLKIFKNF